MTTAPTLEQIDAFKDAWHDADSHGSVGDRVRAGLQAALALTPAHVPPPTLEQFLTAPSDPDEDLEPAPPVDPLESIARSLRTIAMHYGSEVAARTDADLELNAELQRQVEELQADNLRLDALITEALATCAKSTSKVAIAIRAVLAPEAAAEPEPSPEPGTVTTVPNPDGAHLLAPPANDAPIEDWVAFAQASGYTGDLSRTNRSQIRTALGIPQPVGA